MPSLILRRCLAALAISLLIMPALFAVEPAAVVAKARAYLGSEAALNGVTSLRYVGKLTVEEDPANPDQVMPVHMTVEIIFQKPARQRSVLTSENRIETTVLDDYDGWQKVQDPKEASRWTLSLLRSEQIKNLRANVAENLSFFHGGSGSRVTVEDMGTVNVDGVECRKLAFIHAPEIAFHRYFDPVTGRLVLTETRQGESIREEGEIRAGGIRFPKRLRTTFQSAGGAVGRMTIEFDAVQVNETFDNSLFAIPSLGRQ